MNTLEDLIKQYIDAHRDELYDKENKQLTLAGALFVCFTTLTVFGFFDKEK